METLYLITSNQGKVREFKRFLPNIEHLAIDLPEVQSLDPKVVIADKLAVARQKYDGAFIVEDTSLYLDGLNGFPGPLIKWLTQAVGNEGVYKLTQKINDSGAVAKTVIGYADPKGEVHYFEGELRGTIVAPVSMAGEGFGWDEIFKPEGLSETFAEMGEDYKKDFSMRTEAIKQMIVFLNSTKSIS